MGRLGNQPNKLKRIVDRKRWSEEDARVVLAAWRESGQSMATFARGVGVGPWKLWMWRKRLDEEEVSTPRFVPVRLAQGEESVTPSDRIFEVELELPRGLQVRAGAGFDPEKVAELVLALERGPC
jgi:transposase-like protein